MRHLSKAFALWLALLSAGSSWAQDNAAPPNSQDVLVVNLEALYANSDLGRQITAQLDDLARAAQLENDEIRSQLESEERDLTVRRSEMDAEAFREAAEAFDQKVQIIRAQRDAKEREITQQRQNAQAQFNAQVREIIGQVMLERGGAVVLDGRSVYLARSSVDITSDVISRLNGLDAQILDNPPE